MSRNQAILSNYCILYDIYALRFRCVNGLYRMALFSRKSIEANEELTYDYNFSLFNPHEGQACKCGSGTRYQQFSESNTMTTEIVITHKNHFYFDSELPWRYRRSHPARDSLR